MKPGINFFYFLTWVVFLAFFSSCNNGDKGQKMISFKFNLPAGNSYHYIISNEQNVQSTGSSIKLSTTIEVNYQKQKDSADLQLIKSTIDRVAVKINSPVMNVSFDSKSGDAPSVSQSSLDPMFHLVNQSFLLYLNKDGVINKIAHLTESSSTEVNDSLLMQTLGKSFDFYPAKPVTIGDSWETTTTLAVQGINTSLKTTYTLKSVSGDTALIAAASSLKAPERNLVMNNVSMKIKLAGTQSGTLKVFIPEGRLLHASFSSKITGIFQAQGQEMKSVTEGISTITSEKE